jgi:hypothetical protein
MDGFWITLADGSLLSLMYFSYLYTPSTVPNTTLLVVGEIYTSGPQLSTGYSFQLKVRLCRRKQKGSFIPINSFIPLIFFIQDL